MLFSFVFVGSALMMVLVVDVILSVVSIDFAVRGERFDVAVFPYFGGSGVRFM